MQYEYFLTLKNHPAWRLLRADSAPLILSFFHLVFIKPNRRSMGSGELSTKLEDHLHHLRQIHGEGFFPRPAMEYLDTWADGNQAFLRKYYPEKGDEPEFDMTPAAERVIEWLDSLEQRQFVGAESRLLTIFRLLREIDREAVMDPEERIQDLLAQKARIEADIAALKQGLRQPKDKTRIRERFLLVSDTARRLLSDFRQIEENFRRLDQDTRARIAVSDQPKGALLDEIFGQEDAIRDSDQGRSFRAFWSYLMSPASQEELELLISRVTTLPEIASLQLDENLGAIRFRLLDAGAKVEATCGLLVEQLRKFLDNQAWLENRRIMGIIRNIEKQAVSVRQNPPTETDFSSTPDVKADLNLLLERGLFRPSYQLPVDDTPKPGKENFDTPALYDQHHVDPRVLRGRIKKALKGRDQITLEELCRSFPVEQGVSEVIAYLHLACKDEKALVESWTTEQISWRSPNGRRGTVHMPRVIFTR